MELLPDGENLRLVADVGWSPALADEEAVTVSSPTQAAYTISSGGPVLVEDLRTDTRFQATAAETKLGVVSGLSVTIASRGDRPYGVLSVHSTRRRRFAGDDVNFTHAGSPTYSRPPSSAARPKRRFAKATSTSISPLRSLPGQGVWEWDLQSGELQWSDEIRRMHGYSMTDPPPTFDEYLLG